MHPFRVFLSLTDSPELPVGGGTFGYRTQAPAPQQTTQQSGTIVMTAIHTDVPQDYHMTQQSPSKPQQIDT